MNHVSGRSISGDNPKIFFLKPIYHFIGLASEGKYHLARFRSAGSFGWIYEANEVLAMLGLALLRYSQFSNRSG